MTRDRLAKATGLVVALALGACGNGPGGPDGNQGTATLRLMNAAAGSTALDLVVGGQIAAAGVPYEQTSPLATVPGGVQTVAIRRSGEQAVLTSRSLTLTPGAKYNFTVSGPLGSLALLQSEVVDTGLPKPDRANIRIINVSSVVLPADSSSLPPPIFLNVSIAPSGLPLASAATQLSLDARVPSYSTLMYFDPGTLVVRFVTAGTMNVVARPFRSRSPRGKCAR